MHLGRSCTLLLQQGKQHQRAQHTSNQLGHTSAHRAGIQGGGEVDELSTRRGRTADLRSTIRAAAGSTVSHDVKFVGEAHMYRVGILGTRGICLHPGENTAGRLSRGHAGGFFAHHVGSILNRGHREGQQAAHACRGV